MRTQELIAALARDALPREPSPGRAIALALAAGAAGGLLVFLVLLGPRHDFAAALHSPRFVLKFVVTLVALAVGLALAARLARPGGEAKVALLALPLATVGGGVLWEALTVPEGQWMARLVGVNAVVCLASIPVIAAAPFCALLLALRTAAPTRPRFAGAAAGLLAGAVGATFYASHCPDDSPFFVATWYTLGIGAVTAAGALAGERLLRW
jgi:hypothetical protein